MLAALLALLLLLALLVPVLLALHARGDSDDGFLVSIDYRVLGVVRGTRVLRAAGRRASHAAPATPPDGGQPAPAAPAAGKRSAAPSRRARLRRATERLELVLRVLHDGALQVRRPAGWVEFALGDPAQTGQAYGVACAVAALADPAGAVRIAPLWTATDWLAADLTLAARLHPLPLARVLLPAWWRTRREQRRRVAEAHAHAA